MPHFKSQLYIGGFYPELESAFIEHVRSIKQSEPFAPIRVIAANSLLGRYLARRLAEQDTPHLNIYFQTLPELARIVADPLVQQRGLQPLPPGGDVILIRRLIEMHAKRLSYFKPIRQLQGFEQSLLAAFSDFIETGITHRDLNRYVQTLPSQIREKQAEVALLYEHYCRALEDKKYYCESQLGNLAIEALKADTARELTGRAIFYGFYDLNTQQRALLQAIFNMAETVLFFPWRPLSAYEYAVPTLEWLRTLRIEETVLPIAAGQPPKDELPTGLQRLREVDIFKPDNLKDLAAQTGGVEIISAPSEESECREIARRIFSPKGISTALWENGILMRTPAVYQSLWRDLFMQVDPNAWFQGGNPLAETAAVKCLLLLARIFQADFERGAVMEFLSYAPLQYEALSLNPEMIDIAEWERLGIECGIIDGRKNWLDKLNSRLVSASKSRARFFEDEDLAEIDQEIASLESLLFVMQALADCARRLPSRAGSWKLFSDQLIDIYGAWIDPLLPHRQAVFESIGEMAQLDSLAPETTLDEFIATLIDLLQGRMLPNGGYERTGPALCRLLSSRGVTWKRAFVPGLTERSFPFIQRQNPILSDSERRLFNSRFSEDNVSDKVMPELNLVERSRQEERLLFQLAVESARETLVLSFPRLDSSNRPRHPSYFMEALAQTLAPGDDRQNALDDFPNLRTVGLSRLKAGPPQQALTLSEFDLSQRLEIEPSGPDAIARYLIETHPRLRHSVRMDAGRFQQDLSVYDGMLRDPEIQQMLKAGYSPLLREISTTRLENYATCPFQYFMRYVLRLIRNEAPETIEAISALDLGSLLHQIYQDFYSEARKGGQLPLTADRFDELKQQLLEQARRHFSRAEREGRCGYSAIWNARKKGLEGDLVHFLENELDEAAQWLPEMFEVSFGKAAKDPEQAEAFPGLELEIDERGEPIRFQGRIDRLDRVTSKTQFRVIDYKTGKLKKDPRQISLRGGRELQRPIYILAARQITKQDVASAEYRSTTGSGGFIRCPFSAELLEEKAEDLKTVIRHICRGIESGRFFHVPDEKTQCAHCDYKGPCGHAREERYEQKQRDPARLEFDDLNQY